MSEIDLEEQLFGQPAGVLNRQSLESSIAAVLDLRHQQYSNGNELYLDGLSDKQSDFYKKVIEGKCTQRSIDLAIYTAIHFEDTLDYTFVLLSENAHGKGNLKDFDTHSIFIAKTKDGKFLANSPANGPEYRDMIYEDKTLKGLLNKIKQHCGGYWLEDEADDLENMVTNQYTHDQIPLVTLNKTVLAHYSAADLAR